MPPDIGLEIKLLRERRGLTGKDLAARIGLSQSQMSRLEKGQRRIDAGLLDRIATALGVKPSFFFGESQTVPAEVPATAPEDMGRIVRRERHQRHLSAEDLGKKIGRDRAYILALESGSSVELDKDTLGKVCKALRCDPLVFLDAQEKQVRSLRQQLERLAAAHSERALSSVRTNDGRTLEAIPVLGGAASGYPRSFAEDGGPLADVEDVVYVQGCRDPGAFALTVCGDRMNAPGPVSFKEGDLVIFSPRPEVLSRDFAFARVEGQAPDFTQVFFDAGGQVRLAPLNRNYPPIVVPKSAVLGLWRAVARVERF